MRRNIPTIAAEAVWELSLWSDPPRWYTLRSELRAVPPVEEPHVLKSPAAFIIVDPVSLGMRRADLSVVSDLQFPRETMAVPGLRRLDSSS